MNRLKSSVVISMRLAPWAMCIVLLFILARQRGTTSPQISPAVEVAGREALEPKHLRKNQIHFTAEEWDKARELLAKECPRRMRRIESLEKQVASGKKVEAGLRAQKFFIISAARDLQQLKEELPALYSVRLREVSLEDDIYGISLDSKRNNLSKQALRERLRPKMVELVKVGLQVRKGRISLIENAISEQKKLLEADEKNQEVAVDRRLDETIVKILIPKSKSGATTDPSSVDE